MNETRRFVLTATTLRVLGRALDITVDHAPLELPADEPVTAEHVRTAFEELTEAGLGTPDGVAPEVERALRLLADPDVAVTATAELADGPWAARACFDGQHAVLVEQVDTDVVVTRLPVPGWEPGLAALLPRLEPAPGEPVTTVVDDSGHEVDERSGGIAYLPTSAGPSTLADVTRVLDAPRTAGGCFAVTTRERGAATPDLAWVNTPLGSYAITTDATSGRTRTAYVPVDNTALGTLLSERVGEASPVAV